jgi:hypothetical protein
MERFPIRLQRVRRRVASRSDGDSALPFPVCLADDARPCLVEAGAQPARRIQHSYPMQAGGLRTYVPVEAGADTTCHSFLAHRLQRIQPETEYVDKPSPYHSHLPRRIAEAWASAVPATLKPLFSLLEG